MEITLQNVADKIYENALLFNKIVDGGKGFDELDKETLLSRIKQQYVVAREEVDETLKAIEENDEIELLDGLIDSVYTVPIFISMIESYTKKDFSSYDFVHEFEDGDLYNKLIDDYLVNIPLNEYDVGKLAKAAGMIIENNMSKFTTSEEEFNTWTSPYNRKSLDVDGVKYYFFVDDNGKVKKRDNFPSVDLSVLF